MHGKAIAPSVRIMNDPAIVPISMKGKFANNLRGRWLSKHDKDSILGKKRRDVGDRPTDDHFRPALSRESRDRLYAPKTLKLRNPVFTIHGNICLNNGPLGVWPLAETRGGGGTLDYGRPRTTSGTTSGALERTLSLEGVSEADLLERRRLLQSQKDLFDVKCDEIKRIATERRARTRGNKPRGIF